MQNNHISKRKIQKNLKAVASKQDKILALLESVDY